MWEECTEVPSSCSQARVKHTQPWAARPPQRLQAPSWRAKVGQQRVQPSLSGGQGLEFASRGQVLGGSCRQSEARGGPQGGKPGLAPTLQGCPGAVQGHSCPRACDGPKWLSVTWKDAPGATQLAWKCWERTTWEGMEPVQGHLGIRSHEASGANVTDEDLRWTTHAPLYRPLGTQTSDPKSTGLGFCHLEVSVVLKPSRRSVAPPQEVA